MSEDTQNTKNPAGPAGNPGAGAPVEGAGGAGGGDPAGGVALDFDRLLASISRELPVGDYLIYEGTYDRIREARRADDPSLPQGVWERELKRADWKQVAELCIDALETRTKDLQIAVWLLEGLIHLDGFSGLRLGLQLILELSQTYWDTIHPGQPGIDLDSRIAPLIWLNEKLSVQLKFCPVTHPKAVDAVVYTFADWERANAQDTGTAKDKRPKEQTAEIDTSLTRAKFLSSVMFTSRRFYEKQYADIDRALESLAVLGELLDEKCGPSGPSLKLFRDTLEDILSLADRFIKDKAEEVVSGSGLASEGVPDTDAAGYAFRQGDDMKYVSLSIRSRAEAYRMLSEAADYLMIHEPHSPTPYLVKRAVGWGHMSLTELLQELVNDEKDLKLIFNLLGVKS